MLAQLTIQHFLLIDAVEINFQPHMTAITGETGAGKSIILDALSLCLGSRVESQVVRPGYSKASITATFILRNHPKAQQWLLEHQLDEQQECILRRIITRAGRSRGFINGVAVPLAQLKQLGQILIQIHGQQAHQRLFNTDHQREIVDSYITQPNLLLKTRQAYQQWKNTQQTLAAKNTLKQQELAHLPLLDYQLDELTQFAPQEGEYQTLEYQHHQLANHTQIVALSQQALDLLAEAEPHNILKLLHKTAKLLQQLTPISHLTQPILALFEQATIHLEEAKHELNNLYTNLDGDISQLALLEQRLAQQRTLARKYQITPPELPVYYQQLLQQRIHYQNSEQDIQSLEQELQQNYQHFLLMAQQLHQQRQQAANKLAQHIETHIRKLNMPHAKFQINVLFDEQRIQADGADQLEFQLATTPGLALTTLAKAASGGELSRIALAIEAITAYKMANASLVFDEIDVGISGQTAAIVGQLLNTLSLSTQLICITHLPQVAGHAHQHLVVNKQTDSMMTQVTVQYLDKNARLQELARLLSGNTITRNTLANAKELLVTVC